MLKPCPTLMSAASRTNPLPSWLMTGPALHAIFRRAVKLYGLAANPVASVDRFRVRSSGDIQVFSPEEVRALVRAAGSEAETARGPIRNRPRRFVGRR